MKRLWRSVKNTWLESGVSLPKIASTALAAVTVTLLSPKIAAWTNSLLAVALISMISALLGASYSTMMSLTAKGAKKVTQKVVDEVGVEKEPDDRPTIESIVEKAPERAMNAQQKKVKALVTYAMAFVVISLMTVAGSWVVAQAAVSDNSSVPLMQVLEHTRPIDEETIEEISDRAADKVDNPETVVEKETEIIKEVVPGEDPKSDSALENEATLLEQEIKKIQNRLTALESQDLSNLVSEADLDLVLENIGSLTAQVDDLEYRVSQLEGISPEPDSSKEDPSLR